MQIDFNYVGCYRAVCKQNRWKKSKFSIKVGVQAPRLRDHLIPDTLNTVKKLEPHEILDLTPRQGEIYIDDGAGEKMETILQFIEKMDSKETVLKQRIGCEIVCNRGLLVKIAMGGKIEFRAVKRKDVIFVCMTSRPSSGYDFNRHLSMKFEKLMTNDFYYMKASNNLKLIRTGIRTKVVNQIKFPEVTVFSSAEVDCTGHNGNIVELKMTRKSRKDRVPKIKRMKEFLQCYLSNTDHIFTGYLKQKEDYYFEIDELEMINRDSRLLNISEFDNYIQRLSDNLLELKTLLSENDTAVLVTGVTSGGLKYEYIDADDCEFVTEKFLSQFD